MDEIDWDNLPPTTIPETLSLRVQGFNDPEVATMLGQTVLESVSVMGSFMDLATLDGITVAVDYDAALAGLDRGMDDLRPLSRSDSAEIQGVAMSPAVMRDGEVKTHLVFDAAMLVQLINPDATADDRAESVGIISHECAHVEITARKEEAIPEARFDTRIEGFERAITFQIAEVAWDEYAACRMSAPFAPRQNASHAETLKGVVARARDAANDAIRRYRLHRDIERVVDEAAPPLLQPIKVAAYLLGGMDGARVTWEDVGDVRAIVDAAGYADLIDRLRDILRDMWATREEWTPSLDVFAPLQALATDVLRLGGLTFRSQPDGSCWVDVGYSAETVL